ncbi:MAG TPA: hypothetical protein VGC21_05530 [Telluria sp.]|jgi:hypothetical protein
MRFHLKRATLPAAALCIATLFAAAPASATRVMDLEAEQLIRAAGFVRESLTLTPNQQTLYQQVNARSVTILRARQSRRDRLQAALKAGLADPSQPLRDLGTGIEQEAAASAAEDRELRELWLSLCDALTDAQRGTAAEFLLSQLERVDAAPPGERGAGERGPGERGPGQGGKGRRGGGGGAGAGI